MTFAQLLTGQSVFLDANVLVFHFQPHPVFGPPTQHLVARIEQQDLLGYTSTHVLSELVHRLMIIEASGLPGWGTAAVKLRLQKHPTVVQGLSRYRVAIEAVLQSRIQVLTVSPQMTLNAADVSRQIGLLSNDALIVAVMQANGLTHLASADSDFDRVPGITRYEPA
jgi:predicted nucleic acid-binding protein